MVAMKKWIAKYYRLIIVIAIIGATTNTFYTLSPALSGGNLSGLETISVVASLVGIALLALALILSAIESRRKKRDRQRSK
jgi:uncharacterized membrane protein